MNIGEGEVGKEEKLKERSSHRKQKDFQSSQTTTACNSSAIPACVCAETFLCETHIAVEERENPTGGREKAWALH